MNGDTNYNAFFHCDIWCVGWWWWCTWLALKLAGLLPLLLFCIFLCISLVLWSICIGAVKDGWAVVIFSLYCSTIFFVVGVLVLVLVRGEVRVEVRALEPLPEEFPFSQTCLSNQVWFWLACSWLGSLMQVFSVKSPAESATTYENTFPAPLSAESAAPKEVVEGGAQESGAEGKVLQVVVVWCWCWSLCCWWLCL